jgi:hypothetical protein
MSKIPEHIEQDLQSFFEPLVPSAIGLRSLLYERQANSSKTMIQEVKIEKETKANKVVLHLVKVKEEIANLEIDPTSNEAIFSYINKVYIEKFNKYIYYRWVVKSANNLWLKGEREITSSA